VFTLDTSDWERPTNLDHAKNVDVPHRLVSKGRSVQYEGKLS
jgi:hypothetical protein